MMGVLDCLQPAMNIGVKICALTKGKGTDCFPRPTAVNVFSSQLYGADAVVENEELFLSRKISRNDRPDVMIVFYSRSVTYSWQSIHDKHASTPLFLQAKLKTWT